MSDIRLCDYDGCAEIAPYQCECCGQCFCSDHGTVGGDREGREGEVAQYHPNQCWQCGGYNADESESIVRASELL